MNTVSRKTSTDTSVFSRAVSGAASYSYRREPLESRPPGIDLDQKWKRELFRPPSTGLSPREGTRDAPRLLSHSTRPWLPQSPAAGLSKRGRCCSAPSFEGKPQLRLCVAARLAGSRGHAAPDRLKSQAWPSNLAVRAQVPYAIQNFVFRSARRSSRGELRVVWAHSPAVVRQPRPSKCNCSQGRHCRPSFSFGQAA